MTRTSYSKIAEWGTNRYFIKKKKKYLFRFIDAYRRYRPLTERIVSKVSNEAFFLSLRHHLNIRQQNRIVFLQVNAFIFRLNVYTIRITYIYAEGQYECNAKKKRRY